MGLSTCKKSLKATYVLPWIQSPELALLGICAIHCVKEHGAFPALGSLRKGMLLTFFRTTLCLLFALVLGGLSAQAQISQLQVGLGAWPGAGLQAGHVLTRSVYTLEVTTSIDTELWEERTPVHVSAGVGTAFRPLGILRVIGRANYAYDLYFGVRFGPALTFLKNASRAEKNRQFSLFLDPYIRYTVSIGRQPVFAEIGSQRPSFRFGLWIAL